MSIINVISIWIEKTINYRVLLHFPLAMIVFLIFHKWLALSNIGSVKLTLIVAVGWELSEVFWNTSSYSSNEHQINKSIKDILMAVLACTVCYWLV